jgi:hypothetical protein
MNYKTINEYGAVGGMEIGRRKSASLRLCPPEISHLIWDRTRGRRGGKTGTNRLSYGTALHIFLTYALRASEWSASLPGRFIPRKGASGTHWIGGWVNPRAGLDVVANRKIFLCLLEMELRSFIPLPNNYTD